MIGEKGLGWELQWHRSGGESVCVGLSRPVVHGLATAFVAAAAIAVGCGLVGGLDRIASRGGLAAVAAENRALLVRRDALRERLQELGASFEEGADRGRSGDDDGARRDPNVPRSGFRSAPEPD